MELQKPEKPKFSLKYLEKKGDALAGIAAGFAGKEMTAHRLTELAGKLHAAMPPGILQTTVRESLLSLVGTRPQASDLRDLGRRLAWSLEQLRDFRPVHPWTRQYAMEWVLAEVVRIRLLGGHGKFRRWRVLFRLSGGSATGWKTAQDWSWKMSLYLAHHRDEQGNGFGFGRSRVDSRGMQKGKFLYEDIRQMFGMKCLLLLDPDRSKNSPGGREIGHTAGTMKANRALIAWRDRRLSDCPILGDSAPHCWHCPYGTEKCPNAVRPATLNVVKCSRCGRRRWESPDDEAAADSCPHCRKEKQ